eukprot:Awhi_evm1s4183
MLRPLRRKDADSVARKLYKIFCMLGFPNIISSHNGSEFKNDLLASVSKLTNIARRFGSSYKPQTQGSNERRHIEIKKLLKAELEGKLDWPTAIPGVQAKINLSISNRHKSNPFSLFFGRQNNLIKYLAKTQSLDSWEQRLDQLYNVIYLAVHGSIDKYYQNMAKSYNKKKNLVKFEVGDIVKVSNHNDTLGDRYVGPYMVAERIKSSFLLRELNGDPAIGIRDTLIPPEHMLKVRRYDCTAVAQNSKEFKSIIDDCINDNQQQAYLVRWKDNTESWITADDFDGYGYISKYWRKKLMAEKRKRAKN